jgi:hypothetical protein
MTDKLKIITSINKIIGNIISNPICFDKNALFVKEKKSIPK